MKEGAQVWRPPSFSSGLRQLSHVMANATLSYCWSALPPSGSVVGAVRRLLNLAGKAFIIVIDEFDRIVDPEAMRLFSSTIKGLWDHLLDATFILVGVADTVDESIQDHASSTEELSSIIRRG
jgi:hypothetical protein